MKKNIGNVIALIVGLVLLGSGLFLIRAYPVEQGVLRALPYVCIGLGCGLFGQGVSGFVNRAVLKKNPEIAKQQEIEQKDERNQEIASRAKAKAYDAMIFVFGALMVAFALMGIDLVPVLLLVGAYLYVVGVGIYYRCKLEKEL
ncbi:MAG: DUF6442 family protein [Eubacteriales bacterium]|nr:DUF6442 family protein [Eubacteriales bacterium]